MRLKLNNIGSRGGRPSKIIELIINSFDNVEMVETITNLDGTVDLSFIKELKDIANELEEQNQKINQYETTNQ